MPDRTANLLLIILLITGLYAPTSISGEQSRWLTGIPGAAAITVALILVIIRGINRKAVVLCCLALGALIFFTLIGPFHTLTFGTLLSYTALCAVACTNLRDIEARRSLRVVWATINGINISIATLIILDWAPAKEFLVANYSAFYEDLVPNMVAASKPVLSFGSHSIASFFFFVCFYLHLRDYSNSYRWHSLTQALIYLSLLGFLKSVSALLLMPAGLLLLVYHTRGRRAALIVAGLVVTAAVTVISLTRSETQETIAQIVDAMNTPESGFEGRYSKAGVLAADLEYIADHPFSGVGIGYSESLWYGDSGPVELMLRGSLPLLIGLYGAFWMFLRSNLRGAAIGVFLMYMAFEIGFSNLLYPRTACLLPFLVVHLNSLAPVADN